jgi:hypothetical protein
LIREERLGTVDAVPNGPTDAPNTATINQGVTRGAPTGLGAKLVPLASASQLQRARGLTVPTPTGSNNTEPIKDGN